MIGLCSLMVPYLTRKYWWRLLHNTVLPRHVLPRLLSPLLSPFPAQGCRYPESTNPAFGQSFGRRHRVVGHGPCSHFVTSRNAVTSNDARLLLVRSAPTWQGYPSFLDKHPAQLVDFGEHADIAPCRPERPRVVGHLDQRLEAR